MPKLVVKVVIFVCSWVLGCAFVHICIVQARERERICECNRACFCARGSVIPPIGFTESLSQVNIGSRLNGWREQHYGSTLFLFNHGTRISSGSEMSHDDS